MAGVGEPIGELAGRRPGLVVDAQTGGDIHGGSILAGPGWPSGRDPRSGAAAARRASDGFPRRPGLVLVLALAGG